MIQFKCRCLRRGLQRVPRLAAIVVVTGKEHSPARREIDRGDSGAETRCDILEIVDLRVASKVKQLAAAVVRATAERQAIAHKLNSVDVCLMPYKSLRALPASDVPYFAGGIARGRHEHVRVLGVHRSVHGIAAVIGKHLLRRGGLHIPKHASRITGCSH